MKTTSMPNSLPFLPGNVYSDPTITRYHKTHLLDLKNGIITGKSFKSAVTLANLCRKNDGTPGTHQPRTSYKHALHRR